ncbi:sensor histidine kinase [Spirosoma fluviale]|uniref:Histidine kinase n=1 Tax=Spirosoma fluviale TaxID=1597977 RepID=A0A286FED1_9BACT|nr:histidine kinase [Spirosoma fluviale]SOD81595.1 Histidine kinase [Spirosoma fluviale]
MNKTHVDPIRRWLRLTTRGMWSYVLLMPWFVPLISYLLVGQPYVGHWRPFVGATLLIWLLSTIAFVTHDWAANAITHRYPGLRQTVLRAGLTVAAFCGLSGSFLLVYTWYFINYRPFGSQLSYESVSNVYVFDFIAILLLVGIYETAYSLYRWQQHQMNKEKLKKENLQGQLQGLKSQVNPHFLFNSLNSLSSLIADEPQRAEQFVNEMASVYRYMLQTNRQPAKRSSVNQWNGENGGVAAEEPDDEDADQLTSLDNELTFIESYYHLLKTRHGAGLDLTIDVGERYRQHRIPPLTLQLLVENAVKHNVILASRPLKIEILTTDTGFLIVRNNLQRKNIRSGLNRFESTQFGLINIQAKYQLLGCPQLAIAAGPDYFTVTLPLLTKTQTNL